MNTLNKAMKRLQENKKIVESMTDVFSKTYKGKYTHTFTLIEGQPRPFSKKTKRIKIEIEEFPKDDIEFFYENDFGDEYITFSTNSEAKDAKKMGLTEEQFMNKIEEATDECIKFYNKFKEELKNLNEDQTIKVENLDLYSPIRVGSKLNDGTYEITIEDIVVQNLGSSLDITFECNIKNDKENRTVTFHKDDFLKFLNLDKVKTLDEAKTKYKAYIKRVARGDWESGQPMSSDDFELFKKYLEEDGFKLSDEEYKEAWKYYWDCYYDCMDE